MHISTQEVRAKIREVRTDEHKVGQCGFGMMPSPEFVLPAMQDSSIDRHEKKIGITDISSDWTRVSCDHTPYRDGRGYGDTDLFQP
ncbi:MAG TPA: hypothetical protein VIU12_04295 [Chryseolinea sp.]